MSLLAADNIHARRGERAVLQGVSLHANAGEVVGLIGPNGAGKSTFCAVLAGLLAPAEGELTLMGRAMRDIGPRERAKELAYLPQAPDCHWPLVVEQVVALGRLPHRSPWAAAGEADRQAVNLAMERLEVTALADRIFSQLSGGEKMRVLLARALAGSPRVLLADEPVDGLDPAHQLEVMGLLAEQAARGCGIVVVLHDLVLAGRFCDRLVLLDQGKVLAAGTPAAVLTPENCARAYGIETARFEHNGSSVLVPWRRLPTEKRP
jgi:iron complex transport system ATP-binding protein